LCISQQVIANISQQVIAKVREVTSSILAALRHGEARQIMDEREF
jgi:hypothetical protein